MASGSRGSLRAGAAKIDITPQDLTGLTNLWGRPFEGVHDRIYARALVVDSGMNSAAIVAADLVEFGDTIELRAQIEEEVGIPRNHIIVTASHDHNAPRVGSITPGATAQKGGPATGEYTRIVYESVVDVVRRAKEALQPAQVGIGKGTADVNTNRNLFTAEGWKLGVNPDGPSEKTVWVVTFQTETGDPFAILMNYAVHSVVLGANNTLVTGDLAGAAERYVEQHYDGKVVALWTLGPAGDQNPKYMSYNEEPPRFPERAPGYPIMDALGLVLGEEVLRVANHIERTASEVRIEADERVVSCPARIPPRDQNRDGIKVEPVDSLNIRLGLVMIDHIVLTWVSGEVVTDIYRHLRQDSPFSNTIMITLANDRVGYIVDDAGYDTPTFQSTASPFQPGHAESAIVNGLVEMMSQY